MLALSLTFGSAPAKASDWGCQVLLCLANPGGPTQYAECVPPITKLWDALSKVPPDPFPTCDFADGNGGSSHAQQVFDAYDPCPDGTTAAASGTLLAEGTKNGQQNGWYNSISNFNITQPEQTSQPNNCDGDGGCNAWQYTTPRACVGPLVGTYHVGGWGDDGGYDVNVYSPVVWQQPQSPRAIDVYIDNKLYKRVHW